jgi:hypothetical protein
MSVVLHRLLVTPARVLVGLPTLAAFTVGVAGWQIRHPHARKVHR